MLTAILGQSKVYKRLNWIVSIERWVLFTFEKWPFFDSVCTARFFPLRFQFLCFFVARIQHFSDIFVGFCSSIKCTLSFFYFWILLSLRGFFHLVGIAFVSHAFRRKYIFNLEKYFPRLPFTVKLNSKRKLCFFFRNKMRAKSISRNRFHFKCHSNWA